MAYKYISSMPGVKAETDVSYSYICEHCERASGVATKTFQAFMADPSHLKGSQALPPEYFTTMSILAKDKLKKEIDIIQEQIKDGKYWHLFSDNLRAQCPHCGEYQSWWLKVSWKDFFNFPFFFGIVVLMILTFYTMFKYGLDNMDEANWHKYMIITLIGAGIGLMVAVIGYVKTKKRTGKVKVKKLPIIHFPNTEFARTTISTIHINAQGECTSAS